jgi:hypothetical protein
MKASWAVNRSKQRRNGSSGASPLRQRCPRRCGSTDRKHGRIQARRSTLKSIQKCLILVDTLRMFLARIIRESCASAHTRPSERQRRADGFRRAAEQLVPRQARDREPVERLKTNPGFVVSSAERLILSKRPTGRGSKSLDRLGTMSLSNGPKGGRFTICS